MGEKKMLPDILNINGVRRRDLKTFLESRKRSG